jgi:lipid-binding SYLF domain-containing protein
MNRRSFVALPAAALLAASLAACTTTGDKSSASPEAQRQEINSGVDATLNRLYSTVQGSQSMARDAKGILVFPSVLSGGFIVGAQYGKGALRIGNRTSGYYNIAAGSIGFQAGAQSRALVIMFMTQDSLDKFLASNGWTAGADATVAAAKVGANGSIDTETMHQSVVSFALTNAGLSAGVAVNGTKVTKLNNL